MPLIFLTRAARAALINSIGILGGILGSFITDWALETTRNSAAGFVIIAVWLIISPTAMFGVGGHVQASTRATTGVSQ